MDSLFWDRMIFRGISEESKRAIENMPKKECEYRANELIQQEGEDIDSVCIILSGVIKSTENTCEGKELNSSYYFGGDAFPFYLIYGGIKKTFFETYSLKKSKVVWLSMDELVPVINNDQIFLNNILRFVAEYCCYSKMILRCTQYIKIRQRLIFWLLYMNNPNELIEVPCSQQILADILHVNRSSLNQEIKCLESNGYIRVHKKMIEVLDKDTLREFL